MAANARTNAAGATLWRYDFKFAGERITSRFEFTSEVKAKKAAEREKRRLQRGGARAGTRKSLSGPEAEAPAQCAVTLDQACDRYWNDIGRHHRSASDIERRIAICRRIIGAVDRVKQGGMAAINTAVIVAAVQDRLKEQTLTRYGRPSGKLVSPASANRDIIDQFRPIHNYAALIWEDELVLRRIDWKKARQKEAGEQVCEFTETEIRRWGEELQAGADRRGGAGAVERAFLTLALEYGPRLGELHFPPEAFRPDAPDGPELDLGAYIGKGGRVRTSRKDGSVHTIPLRGETVAMLAPLVEQARAAQARTIWLEPGADGDPAPISYDAMRGRLIRAARRAGIGQARIVHGMRHHAGSAINRQGGLTRVQALLGHTQITTSRRYSHTKRADLRADLEEIRRKKSHSSPTGAPGQALGPTR